MIIVTVILLLRHITVEDVRVSQIKSYKKLLWRQKKDSSTFFYEHIIQNAD